MLTKESKTAVGEFALNKWTGLGGTLWSESVKLFVLHLYEQFRVVLSFEKKMQHTWDQEKEVLWSVNKYNH